MGLNIGSKRILRLGTGSSWTPLDLESTVLWLDPNYGMDASLDGDVIGSWADRLGYVTVIQGTTAKKPILKKNIKNGMPVVRIDAVDDYLQAAMSALSQPYHAFVVSQCNVVGNQAAHNMCIDGDDILLRNALYRSATGTDKFGWFWGKSIFGPAPDTDWHIFTGLANGASSELYMEGSLEVTGDGDTDNADGMTIGSRYDAALNWDGDIGDVIICDPNLSVAERMQVESWLSARWDIALA